MLWFYLCLIFFQNNFVLTCFFVIWCKINVLSDDRFSVIRSYPLCYYVLSKLDKISFVISRTKKLVNVDLCSRKTMSVMCNNIYTQDAHFHVIVRGISSKGNHPGDTSSLRLPRHPPRTLDGVPTGQSGTCGPRTESRTGDHQPKTGNDRRWKWGRTQNRGRFTQDSSRSIDPDLHTPYFAVVAPP